MIDAICGLYKRIDDSLYAGSTQISDGNVMHEALLLHNKASEDE